MTKPRFHLLFCCGLLLALISPAFAQVAPETGKTQGLPHQWRFEKGVKILPPPVYQNETPEQRQARLGTVEDPGPDPDPAKKWIRFGKTYTILKFPRSGAAYDVVEYGWVRPLYQVNIPVEIYQENEQFVWVWMPEVELIQPDLDLPPDVENLPQYNKYEGQGREFVLQVREEFSRLEPPLSEAVIRFRESSEGLPKQGSWRNGLDVADMNGDGFPDLIVPPQRGGVGSLAPYIFLGDGTGKWQLWRGVQWPASLNYGTVAAGDLNGDGHQDLAFGVHLQGIFAFLGDGKGKFTNASEGLPKNFPTRRVALRDVNGDGLLDIVGISEGANPGPNLPPGEPLRVYVNEKKATRWRPVAVAEPARQVAGDWLALANLNEDRYPDIAGASVIFHGTDLIYLSEGKEKWKPFGRGWLPFYSYYGPVTAAKISSKKRDDLVMTFSRIWPETVAPADIPPPSFTRVIGLERITFDRKGPKRIPIARWEGHKPIWGLASADFDRDGNQDIIYWESGKRQAVMLLGSKNGDFRKATVEGLQLPSNTLYDIKVADVNQDRSPDLILMFEASGTDKDGSIRVWLSEPGTAPAGPKSRVANRQP